MNTDVLSQPHYEIVFEKNLEIPMRDGTVLRADLTRPAADGPFPTLLERTPYNKDGASENAVGSPEFFAKRGYAVIIQDVRGRFASDGEFYPFRDDGAGANQDGYDTIEWIATQPWCDGNVGTIGGSYSGATQYRAALSRPPHLRATFVRESSADYNREWVYRDGAFEHGFSTYWAHTVTESNLKHLVDGVELERQKKELRQVGETMEDWLGKLPVYPCTFLEGLSDWHNEWLDNPLPGPYWDELNIEPYHDQVETPMYHQGAWFDIFLAGTLKNYVGMKAKARTAEARSNQKLIIGPWIHGSPSINKHVVGEFDFGQSAAKDFNEMRLPWFDYWLKGIDTGVMEEPPVRIFVMGRNEWRDEEEWPLADTQYVNYYMHGGESGSIESLNDGTLSAEEPLDSETPDTFEYDPEKPVPNLGGATLGISDGVIDQRPVDEICLTYTSEPLTKELEVTGAVKAVLYGISSATDTDWIVRLTDIHPDGYSRPVCDGILRARYRDSFAEPELMTPGAVYRFEIDLWATSNVFLEGHRMRVVVTSSSFPRFDRNLNTGGPIHKEAKGQVAKNSVLHNTTHPSHIVLPVIPPR